MHDGLGPISDQPMPVTRSVIAKNPWALRPAGVRSASSSTSSLANCTASTWCESCPLVCPLTPVLHVLSGPRRLNHGKQNAKQCYSYHGNFALRIRRLGVRISSGAPHLDRFLPGVLTHTEITPHCRCGSLSTKLNFFIGNEAPCPPLCLVRRRVTSPQLFVGDRLPRWPGGGEVARVCECLFGCSRPACRRPVGGPGCSRIRDLAVTVAKNDVGKTE